jgi:hypothetical protein
MPTGVYQHHSQNEVERFRRYVNKTESCWLWTGCLVKGYGSFRTKYSQYAHRFSYFLHHPLTFENMIDSKIEVRHMCDNPKCVSPHHLILGTHADNMNDMKLRGRGAGYNTNKSGEDTNSSKLTKEQVIQIKNRLLSYKRGDETRIGKEYSVSRGCIKSIREGKTWIDV